MTASFDFHGKVTAITGGASVELGSQPRSSYAARLEKDGGQVLATVVDVADSKQVNTNKKSTTTL